MASPKLQIFAVYDQNTGAPLPGLTPTFFAYQKDNGVAVSQPTITDIGNGFYSFTPTFADPTHGICYIIVSGGNGTPARLANYLRPEDWNMDNADVPTSEITNFHEGRWKIFTTGLDANRLVIYQPDGTTVLKKYDLKDAAGNPTVLSPYERVPV